MGALVFDGTGAPAREATVIVRGERIEAVGPALAIPEGASVIDGRGKALLPGFFDLHTHWTPGGQPATVPQIATAYVRSGVTTVNDFHQQPESFAPRRAWLAGLVAPHVSFVARIGTPGGHGADWGDQATTIWINTPEAARAAVERLKPYRPRPYQGIHRRLALRDRTRQQQHGRGDPPRARRGVARGGGGGC
ncbi:MAG: hypothetical protein WDN24_02330 [Sphingomonas sp.]